VIDTSPPRHAGHSQASVLDQAQDDGFLYLVSVNTDGKPMAFQRVAYSEALGHRRKNLPALSITLVMKPCIYILASRRNGSLYIGVTSDIRRRLTQHRDGTVAHTHRYRIRRLVYLEFHDRIVDVIVREKRLKFWRRAWKINLIETANPNWDDLSRQFSWLD
jgi:putative endonuclease